MAIPFSRETFLTNFMIQSLRRGELYPYKFKGEDVVYQFKAGLILISKMSYFDYFAFQSYESK